MRYTTILRTCVSLTISHTWLCPLGRRVIVVVCSSCVWRPIVGCVSAITSPVSLRLVSGYWPCGTIVPYICLSWSGCLSWSWRTWSIHSPVGTAWASCSMRWSRTTHTTPSGIVHISAWSVTWLVMIIGIVWSVPIPIWPIWIIISIGIPVRIIISPIVLCAWPLWRKV